MLIVNADDWGRSQAETDATLECFRHARISSTTAMMFMEDSERAGELARSAGVQVGLHVNLSQPFTAGNVPGEIRADQQTICRFLKSCKYAQLMYNPFLRRRFKRVYQMQAEEFKRLYGIEPSHVDGHQHMHLCANMLVDEIIPKDKKVRRNFSFLKGEKSLVNRGYRHCVDKWLARRYRLTDYFFGLSTCLQRDGLERVLALAKTANVELMIHAIVPDEYSYLMSDAFGSMKSGVPIGSFANL
jgi:predicted glycoside hydrolase/deacetylase ChbG (UPF0249 family)